jgi:membrane protease YdiL (CAAX protease family)
MKQSAVVRNGGSLKWVVTFFIVTYAVTGLLWLPILRAGQSPSKLTNRLELFLLLATIAPSGVALILSAMEGGWSGVRALLAQFGRWRFGAGWYVYAIVVAPLIAVVVLVVSRAMGGSAPTPAAPLQFLIPLAPLGEELGWRGYALPRLQRRMPALSAALLIGLIWACWHLPYFAFSDVHPLAFWIGFPLFAAVIIAESVLAAWLYNSTRGSVLATFIFHWSITAGSVVPLVPGVAAAIVAAVINLFIAAGAVVMGGTSLNGFRTAEVTAE